MSSGPGEQSHLMGRVATLCYERFISGAAPLAIVSTDNCSHNGDKLKAGIMAYVDAWKKSDLVGDSFVRYMNENVSFPWTMIDKITPRPDANVKSILERDGFEDTGVIVTACGTYTAPFVNSEETGYLVIEDDFPNGRPPLEKAGILFTDRETVDKVEKMKVCTCLNPLHTALAVYGCMLGYTSIHDEMEDLELHKLVETMCYEEGMPVVVNPGIIDPRDFAGAVLERRLPNPFMPDTPQRIACDTSQKLPIRFGETIKAYQRRDDLEPSDLTLIPLVIAGWCRYLMGVDDDGNVFEQSPDPRLEEVKEHVSGLELGSLSELHEKLRPILSDSSIFSVDLYEVGLGRKIEDMFAELASGKGAVRATLKKYLGA
jgi:fructuronate reductase